LGVRKAPLAATNQTVDGIQLESTGRTIYEVEHVEVGVKLPPDTFTLRGRRKTLRT